MKEKQIKKICVFCHRRKIIAKLQAVSRAHAIMTGHTTKRVQYECINLVECLNFREAKIFKADNSSDARILKTSLRSSVSSLAAASGMCEDFEF